MLQGHVTIRMADMLACAPSLMQCLARCQPCTPPQNANLACHQHALPEPYGIAHPLQQIASLLALHDMPQHSC